MILGKRIKAIRLAEGMSQSELSQLTGISIHSLRHYEQGTRALSEENLMLITNHDRFQRYTYWLMTGKTLPESGQVCPDFSILSQCGIIDAETVEKRA